MAFQIHWLNLICFLSLVQSFDLTKDQNFERNTFVRSNPYLCPCLIPNGKYMVSGRWSLLGGQEIKSKNWGGGVWCIQRFFLDSIFVFLLVPHPAPQEKLRLQGVGSEDILNFNLNTLTDHQQSDLAGNSYCPHFSSQHNVMSDFSRSNELVPRELQTRNIIPGDALIWGSRLRCALLASLLWLPVGSHHSVWEWPRKRVMAALFNLEFMATPWWKKLIDHNLIQVELVALLFKAVAGRFCQYHTLKPVPYFVISRCSSHRMEPVVKINAVFFNSLSLFLCVWIWGSNWSEFEFAWHW